MKSLPYKHFSFFFFWCRTKVQSLTPKIYLQKEAVTIERDILQLFLGFHLQWLTKSKNSCQNLESRTFKTQSSGQKAESWPEERVCIIAIESMPG